MRIRDRRTQSRYFVDNVIMRVYGEILKPIGIAVYNALCVHADIDDQNCWPSHATIAKMIGAGVTSVKASLKQMRELGLIEWHGTKRADGGTGSNEYYLLDPPSRVVATPQLRGDEAHSRVAATNNPHVEQSPKKKEGLFSGKTSEPVQEEGDLWPTESNFEPREQKEPMPAGSGSTGDYLTDCAATFQRTGGKKSWTVADDDPFDVCIEAHYTYILKRAVNIAEMPDKKRKDWRACFGKIAKYDGDGMDAERLSHGYEVLHEVEGADWNLNNGKWLTPFAASFGPFLVQAVQLYETRGPVKRVYQDPLIPAGAFDTAPIWAGGEDT